MAFEIIIPVIFWTGVTFLYTCAASVTAWVVRGIVKRLKGIKK